MRRAKVVVIGASWGGLDAVGRLLSRVAADCVLSLVVVQHRSPDSLATALANYLQSHCALPVREADDKDALEPGVVYLAPPDYHLLIEPGHVALSIEAPVQLSRPSIDVAFESAADAYGDAVIGVLLTGANSDGAAGMVRIKAAGGVTLVQDPETAERAEMPRAAIRAAAADRILPIEGIADQLNLYGRDA